MAEEKPETKEGYRTPAPPPIEKEYMTTVGVISLRDEFDPSKKNFKGWQCTRADDPIVPPGGPKEWRLYSTTQEKVEFYSSKNGEPKKYDMCFIAIVWTWQRVHGST